MWRQDFGVDEATNGSFVKVQPQVLPADAPIYTPPEGWTLDYPVEVVTLANQASFASGAMPGCGLRAQAVLVAGQGAEADYAPPIGWAVAMISRPAGAAGQDLVSQKTIWISPEGLATSIQDCSSQVQDAGSVTTKKQLEPIPVAKPFPWWLLIGGGLVAAYLIWKK